MEKLEPRKPRRQELDYSILPLPEEVLAIVRVSWYKDGKAVTIDEAVIMEDGQDGYDAFAETVTYALKHGANVSIQSEYMPQDLGILQ
jgi:hypothetical protein